jgi:hypothetical protein
VCYWGLGMEFGEERFPPETIPRLINKEKSRKDTIDLPNEEYISNQVVSF